ncbi:deoxyribodipyrimidine photolyase single-strand-specific [Vibrio ponticus]|nr:deoxyribodipyrimidine photolyase single-strand-specific [Vibrio ponticus]
MGKKTIGVYWFTNDLRLDDNPLLAQAAQEVDQLICLYCLPSYSEYLKRFTSESHYGSARERFWHQSVASLDQALNEKGQRLVVSQAHPFSALAHLMSNDNVSALYCDDFVAHDERLIVQHLSSYFPLVKICQRSQRTLFQQFELPFTLDALPASFTQFRKMVEGQSIALPHCAINKLPAPAKHSLETVTLPEVSVSSRDDFVGGEHFAHAHMMCYFSTSFASRYKQTRNELDGKENSTKFSPWLAVGSLSLFKSCMRSINMNIVTAVMSQPIGSFLSYCGENTFNGMHASLVSRCFSVKECKTSRH